MSFYCLSAVGLILFCGFAVVQAQQRILRKRAEALLADIQNVTLRSTTFEEIEPIRRRWAGWSDHKGDCTVARCDFLVHLEDLSTDARTPYNRPWYHSIYSFFGGRRTLVVGGISVRNGVVWTKMFRVDLIGTEPDQADLLSAEAQTVRRVQPTYYGIHPEYSATTASPGRRVLLWFTPYIEMGNLEKLMRFDLSCITRWRRCTSPSEIMPAAWQQAERDRSIPPDNRCTPEIIELLARDSNHAATVSVLRNEIVFNSEGRRFVGLTLRLDKYLKPASSENGATFKLGFADGPFAKLKPHTKWIVLFDGDRLGGVEPCMPIPLNEGNLEIVKRGIERDGRPSNMN